MARASARTPHGRCSRSSRDTSSACPKLTVSDHNVAHAADVLKNTSALYHVLTILLHRPFVADGHLYNTSRAISVNSFMACATAADAIVQLLRAYDKTFSVRRAPYLISYATYVAATVHARIAAKRGAGSQAHKSLETCLAVFRENQETNWAVRRANAIIQNLMKRLGVVAPDLNDTHIGSGGEDNHESTPDVSLSRSMDREPSLQSFDIDGIIQSFVREQDSSHMPGPVDPTADMAVPGVPSSAYNTMETANMPYGSSGNWAYQDQQQPFSEQPFSVDDLLYGFNGSELDQFPTMNWDM